MQEQKEYVRTVSKNVWLRNQSLRYETLKIYCNKLLKDFYTVLFSLNSISFEVHLT